MTILSKQKIKRIIARVIKIIGFPGNQVLPVILNYHSIHPFHKSSIRPEDFLNQMEYIASNFKVVVINELLKIRSSAIHQRNKVAVITLDDGYEDNYLYAFPTLKKLGLNATVFLTTGFINGEVDIANKYQLYNGLKPLTWQQILTMRDSGIITFGSHTHTHPLLSKCPLEEVKSEISRSKNILEDKLRVQIDAFAYPFGQSYTFNPKIIEVLKFYGFKSACSTIWGRVKNETDSFALPRIWIDPQDTIADFKDKVNGRWDFIKWIKAVKSIGKG